MTTQVQKRPSPPLRPLVLSLAAATVLMVACGGLALTTVLVLLVIAVVGLMYAIGEALARDGFVPLSESSAPAREVSDATPSIPSENAAHIERAA